MDIAAELLAAHITRVAIIDDDLSTAVTQSDFRDREPGVAALLNDPMDPDLQAYLVLLTKEGYDVPNVPDLAVPLAVADVRNQAPARLRLAAEAVLTSRAERAEPVERVINLLRSLGVDDAKIDRYSTPVIDDDKFYDLIIVDYFLVDTSTDSTLPFIMKVLGKHRDEEHALQVILMSSHDERLKDDFGEIRPEIKASSSRMRIMEKPRSDMLLVRWKAALWQLACDRKDVRELERFINEAGTVLEAAGKSVSKGLWEVDLQAMDLLHELASKDSDDFTRYVEDALSRRLLSAVEADGGMRASLQHLDGALKDHRSQNLLSPTGEVGDSRSAIHGLMQSMEWRSGDPALTVFPAGGSPEEQGHWVRTSIRFGMVLLDPHGTEWLNITQACDLAQVNPENFGSSSVVLIRGQQKLPPVEMKNDYYVSMSAMRVIGENHVLSWNLRDVRAESIANFAVHYGAGWQVLGELRPDRAQNIAAKYASRMSRVGMAVTLSVWRIGGVAVFIDALRAAVPNAPLEGLALSGHAIQRAHSKQHELHLDWISVDALLSAHDTLGESVLNLLTGLSIKPGSEQQLGNAIICGYVAGGVCSTIEQVMNELAKTIENSRNTGKLLIVLWGAS